MIRPARAGPGLPSYPQSFSGRVTPLCSSQIDPFA